MNNRIEDIKKKVTCVEVANMFGASLPPEGGRCRSYRVGATNKSSLQVNPDVFTDYGENDDTQYGDCIELYERFSGKHKAEAIRDLARHAGIEVDDQYHIKFNKQRMLIKDAVEYFASQLKENEEICGYLKWRGMTGKDARDLKIGWYENSPKEHLLKLGYTDEEIKEANLYPFRHRIIFPYFQNGEPVYMIGRSIKEEPKYYKMKRNAYNENSIWGIDSIKGADDVYIAEGIMDAISLYQEGHAVVSAVTGNFTNIQKPILIEKTKSKNVIICMDYDPNGSGQNFMLKLGLEYYTAGKNVNVVPLDGGDEKIDINQIYADTGSLDFLNNQQSFQKYYLTHVKDPEEIKEFIKATVLGFDEADMSSIKDEIVLQTGLSKEWVNKVERAFRNPPKDIQVVNTLLADENLVFHPQLGWHEFGGKTWSPINEMVIRGRVNGILDIHKTGAKQNSVIAVARGDAVYPEDFDMNKEWIYFKNCKYNVETGQVKDHEKEDMATISLTYDYDEKATCPKIEETIDTIFDGDEKSIQLFYEMAGYCLTKDVTYQKCFILFGGGSNGKSVCLNLLKFMVGAHNCSNVGLQNLGDPQNVAMLHGKMLNFCSEISGQMKGAEENFKQIVTGEEVNARFLYQDTFTFQPFCKMIFASNKQLYSSEISEGIRRRFVFLDFPMHFVENPTKSNQRKINKDIEVQLLEELPGFFNLAMKNLHNLRERKRFEMPDCHKKHMRLFNINSNPVHGFFDDNPNLNLKKLWNPMDMFQIYEDWCLKTGERKMNNRVFWQLVEKIWDIEESNTTGQKLITFKEEK